MPATPATFSVLLITAAPPGHGSEAGGAFTKIDGREALLRSAELFLNREPIKQIQMVFVSDMMEEAKRKYGGHLGFSGVKLISAGANGWDQVAAGGGKLSPEVSHVIVHDAARPAVPYSDIDCLIEEAPKHRAIALTAPLRTNLVEVDEAGHPMAYHKATSFVQLLSPLVFAREKFVEIAKSKLDPHASELHLVKGSPLNIRVGGGGDAGFVKTMINMLPKPKIKAPSSPFEEAQW